MLGGLERWKISFPSGPVKLKLLLKYERDEAKLDRWANTRFFFKRKI